MVSSANTAPMQAPVHAPIMVPMMGSGIMKVAKTAPMIAPNIVPAAARVLPPAVFTPSTPARNSANSPSSAKSTMSISVVAENICGSRRKYANSATFATMSQLPGRLKSVRASQAVLRMVSIVASKKVILIFYK